MAKQFRLRISRIIPSFQSCRSKDPSTLPEVPVPSSFRPLSPASSKPIATLDIPGIVTPPSKLSPLQQQRPQRSSFRRHISSVFSSIGCGSFSSKRSSAKPNSDKDLTSDFKWKKEEKWHVISRVYEEAPRRKIYNSSASGGSDEDVLLPPPPPCPPSKVDKKKRRARKKRPTARIRISTSSIDSGLFSSEAGHEIDEEEETETLVSSCRSFSTDSSSEINPHLETIRETTPMTRRGRGDRKKFKKRKESSKLCVSYKSATGSCGGGSAGGYRVMTGMGRKSMSSSPEWETPARLSMFKRLIPCTVDGKIKESFAIVKKSEDPYEDFKRSMMEMILEKQMFDVKDLEQLLQCFLSLNSSHHHGIIVEAFSEIWDALFRSTNKTRPSAGIATARALKPC